MKSILLLGLTAFVATCNPGQQATHHVAKSDHNQDNIKKERSKSKRRQGRSKSSRKRLDNKKVTKILPKNITPQIQGFVQQIKKRQHLKRGQQTQFVSAAKVDVLPVYYITVRGANNQQIKYQVSTLNKGGAYFRKINDKRRDNSIQKFKKKHEREQPKAQGKQQNLTRKLEEQQTIFQEQDEEPVRQLQQEFDD